jgi:hypothetical protein
LLLIEDIESKSRVHLDSSLPVLAAPIGGCWMSGDCFWKPGLSLEVSVFCVDLICFLPILANKIHTHFEAPFINNSSYFAIDLLVG